MKYLVWLLVLFVGCAHVASPNEEIPEDAGYTTPGRVCQEATLDRDPYNCGSCGYDCYAVEDTGNVDGCFAGLCSCGEGAPCGDGEDCRRGQCIRVDPDGLGCEFNDQCITYVGPGYQCLEHRCTFTTCEDETCNGLDDDCDGKVDEAPNDAPLSEWCFSGTDLQLNPPCSAGVRVCTEGTWSDCLGEVPPVDEQGFLACDGLDQDCDGCVDGVRDAGGNCIVESPERYQVAIYIDRSGSMSGTIHDVDLVTDGFAVTYAGQNFEWALVRLPALDGPVSEVVTDFTDLAGFQAALSSLGGVAGGAEPSWDAIYESGLGVMPLSWAPGSVRIQIMFTDEEGQSYRFPEVTEADMCDVQTHGEVNAFFIDPDFSADFDDCGVWFPISDTVTMAVDMASLLVDPCSVRP